MAILYQLQITLQNFKVWGVSIPEMYSNQIFDSASLVPSIPETMRHFFDFKLDTMSNVVKFVANINWLFWLFLRTHFLVPGAGHTMKTFCSKTHLVQLSFKEMLSSPCLHVVNLYNFFYCLQAFLSL